MAVKTKKGLKGSIDDVLSDLLGDDDDIPHKSTKPVSFGDSGGRPRGIASQTSRKGLLEDDINKMPLEKEGDAEDPDISDVDPEALLETLKDMDDMDADILGIKKASSGPVQKPGKDVDKSQPLVEPARSAKKTTVTEKGDAVSGIEKNLSSAPTTSRHVKQKFSFEDIDDPLAGLLSDEEEGTVKKVHSSAARNTLETNAETSTEKVTSPGPSALPERKKEELVFEDDGDNLMDALGFGESSKAGLKSDRTHEGEEPRPARSMLDELLGRGTAAKLLERPGTAVPKEFKLDKKYQKQADKEDILDDEFTFGAYQPTMASSPEGRQSRRQSVRFSSENLSELKTDQRSKPPTPASASPIRSKTGADWLGLKDEGFDLSPPSPLKELGKSGTRGSTPDMPPGPPDDEPPAPTSQLLSRSKPADEGAEPVKADDDSWLSNVLSQKKSQALEKVEKRPQPSDTPIHRKEVDSLAHASQPSPSTQRHQQSVVPADSPARVEEPASSIPWLKPQEQTIPAVPFSSRKGTPSGDTSNAGIEFPAPAASLQRQEEVLRIPAPPQLLHPEPHAQSLPDTSEYEKRLAGVQVQLRESIASYQAELLSAQTRLLELEGQVRRMELEKNQQKLLLESLQQRHQEDLELIEKAHRNRVKMIEESYHQREERLRQENRELAEQYLFHCQSAEQAKSELLAQHQRRLTEFEEEKAKEIDRLQELQRMSILEMRKDHEEQLQRLKQLKNQEIDAVTSATAYTRSLNGIIEQMEKFSSNLNDLSNKVEATHQTTSHGLEIGTRQRDEQLKVLQDRLTWQQKNMEDERGRLQEVISKMEARLNEQTRLLEQERWRVKAEQSKVESLQHSLEEQRKVMTQQLTMEREELERAKHALVEEQKSVMQKCAEERHKLAAEWSELHTQQRLNKERTEREVDRAMQIDYQREGAIMSLAKEQADLKIKANELRSKDEQLARDREILEQEKEELRLEKERVNAAALHIKQRVEEVKSMSKLSSQKYEEGEKALLEARKVESEHQARLRSIQLQMEQLKQQEEYLHQERLNLSHQRRQLEQLRERFPSNPLLFPTMPQVPLSGPPANIISNTHYLPIPVPDLSKANPGASQGLPRTEPADLYAKLVLHKLTAERDHDFLEEEQVFLETLKNAPYKTSSQSA